MIQEIKMSIILDKNCINGMGCNIPHVSTCVCLAFKYVVSKIQPCLLITSAGPVGTALDICFSPSRWGQMVNSSSIPHVLKTELWEMLGHIPQK